MEDPQAMNGPSFVDDVLISKQNMDQLAGGNGSFLNLLGPNQTSAFSQVGNYAFNSIGGNRITSGVNSKNPSIQNLLSLVQDQQKPSLLGLPRRDDYLQRTTAPLDREQAEPFRLTGKPT